MSTPVTMTNALSSLTLQLSFRIETDLWNDGAHVYELVP